VGWVHLFGAIGDVGYDAFAAELRVAAAAERWGHAGDGRAIPDSLHCDGVAPGECDSRGTPGSRGFDWQVFPAKESFYFGITSRDFNSPSSPDYIPTLAAYDLSRGGRLFHYSGGRFGRVVYGLCAGRVASGPMAAQLGVAF